MPEQTDPVKLCEEWFDRYKDPDIQDQAVISPDGCQSFFSDINVELDSVRFQSHAFLLSTDTIIHSPGPLGLPYSSRIQDECEPNG